MGSPTAPQNLGGGEKLSLVNGDVTQIALRQLLKVSLFSSSGQITRRLPRLRSAVAEASLHPQRGCEQVSRAPPGAVPRQRHSLGADREASERRLHRSSLKGGLALSDF